MTGYNLPPGCNESDLPGNRPEDIAWEAYTNGRLQDMLSELVAEALEEAEILFGDFLALLSPGQERRLWKFIKTLEINPDDWLTLPEIKARVEKDFDAWLEDGGM